MGFKGLIEAHSRKYVSGWCVNLDEPAKPVRLQVRCRGNFLKTIVANSPRRDLETSHGIPACGFRFPIDERVHSLIPKGCVLEVIAPDGEHLEIAPNSQGIAFIGLAEDDGAQLFKMLSEGYSIHKWGGIKKTFATMRPEERKAVALAMEAVTQYLEQRFGLTVFIHYGTLLGFTRSAEFLPHDDDVDLSYVIQSDSIQEVAEKFCQLVRDIRQDGHLVHVTNVGQMTVQLKGSNAPFTDLFASWQNSNGLFHTYFGVMGHVENPVTVREARMEGVTVKVPTHELDIMRYTYGPNWITPDPDFVWTIPKEVDVIMNQLRTAGAEELAALEREKVAAGEAKPAPSTQAVAGEPDSEIDAYWNSYYSSGTAPRIPSQFAVFVAGEIDPGVTIDIGCGSGRDSIWFANLGRKVLGIDGSQSAVDLCKKQAKDNLDFKRAHVNEKEFADTIRKAAEESSGPPLLYARFFLHAITDEDQDKLLDVPARTLEDFGGYLAVEYRTNRHRNLSKATSEHFRRYIDPTSVMASAIQKGLVCEYYIDGFGFAKYKSDDAHVARMIFKAKSMAC